MKNILYLAIASFFLLLFQGCGGPGKEPASGVDPDKESLVIIARQDLIPERDGLYYNKNTRKPFTGRVDEYYPFKDIKALKVVRHFKDGKQHGLRIEFYNDGTKRSEIEYKDGKKHGKAINWYKGGQVQWERSFRVDVLDGESTRYDIEGKITEQIVFRLGRLQKAIQ
tara:strand:+ start:650 stop:1153 length:504 start_codon:yes stop_codon:yes gene_type:complete